MALEPFLLEILVDPEDKESLWYFEDEQFLYNPRLKRRYEIKDGIPVLLIGEAESVGEDEARRIEGRMQEAFVTGLGPADPSDPGEERDPSL